MNDKKVDGRLNIEINITCPHCEHYFDLMEDQNLLDDGWLHNLVMPNDNHWSDACNDFSKEYYNSFGEDYTCPSCDKIVDIGKIHW